MSCSFINLTILDSPRRVHTCRVNYPRTGGKWGEDIKCTKQQVMAGEKSYRRCRLYMFRSQFVYACLCVVWTWTKGGKRGWKCSTVKATTQCQSVGDNRESRNSLARGVVFVRGHISSVYICRVIQLEDNTNWLSRIANSSLYGTCFCTFRGSCWRLSSILLCLRQHSNLYYSRNCTSDVKCGTVKEVRHERVRPDIICSQWQVNNLEETLLRCRESSLTDE